MLGDQALHQDLQPQDRRHPAAHQRGDLRVRQHLFRRRIALVDEQRLEVGALQESADQVRCVARRACGQHRILGRRAAEEARQVA